MQYFIFFAVSSEFSETVTNTYIVTFILSVDSNIKGISIYHLYTLLFFRKNFILKDTLAQICPILKTMTGFH